MAERIRVPEQKLTTFCQRHHIYKLSLFGSAIHGDFTQDSDVDVLVEFEPGHIPGYLGFSAMQRELSDLFGRRVDLNTPNSLSRYFRDRILQEAEVLYESDARK